ncbi:MAG: HAD family hydrolase [Rhodoluna sp.]|nr:HAD family hydrolase [Rhodoluna sp.]MBP6186275.1 HAD family hydrolase [Rhodoluna sp.]
MTPETNQPSAAVPRVKQAWWALVIGLPVLFVGFSLLSWMAAASLLVLVFIAVVLLPIGTRFLTVGDDYAVLNKLRDEFELLKSVDTFVLAKTATLTAGEHKVVDVQSFASGVSADQILELACAVERDSSHPIAKAIVSAAAAKQLDDLPAARDLRAIPGVGVTAMVDGQAITIGGPSLLTGRNLMLTVDQLLKVNEENSLGHTVGYVIRDNGLLGFIATSDTLVEAADAQVGLLQSMGKFVAVVSSDAEGVVKWVAREFELVEWFAEVLPHQRAELFTRLKADGKKVAVIGQEFAPDSDDLIQVAGSLAELDSIARRGKQLLAKQWQNRVAAGLLGLAAIPLIALAFSKPDLTTTLVYGSVLISLSTAIAVVQARSMKR